MSVKLAYWLSDVSQAGRGNLKLIPGSHLVDRIDGPPRRDIPWPDPDGAIEITAEPGDAVFFDRRIWHARSPNHSEHTRKAVFFGYTYRWTTIRDDTARIRDSGWFSRLTPVQQQLLGGKEDSNGDHAWGHHPQTTPLYGWLRARGLIYPATSSSASSPLTPAATTSPQENPPAPDDEHRAPNAGSRCPQCPERSQSAPDWTAFEPDVLREN
jgi:ectoine hydroxylase